MTKRRKIAGPPGGVLFIREQMRNVAYDHQRGNFAAPGSATKANRSTPLPYVTMHTGGDISPEGVLYRNRRQALKARPRGWAKLAVYDEIVLTYGGDRIAPLRGFVINYRYESATPAEIAVEIGGEPAMVGEAVRDMLDIGLLCWVRRPGTETKTPQFTFEQALRNDTIGLSPNTTLAFGVEVMEWDDVADDAARARAVQADPPQGGGPFPAGADDSGDQSGPAQASDADAAGTNSPPEGTPHSGAPPAPIRRGAGTAPEKGGLTPNGKTPNGLNGQTPEPAPPSAAPQAAPGRGYGLEIEGNSPVCSGPGTDGPNNPNGRTPDNGPAAQPPDTRTAGTSGTLDAGRPQTAAGDTSHAEPQPGPADPTETDSPAGASAVADMTWHAESMAAQVFQIMYPTERDLIEQGLRHTKGGNPKPETPEEFGRTEMASFAASFGRALAGMSQVEALHLLQRSIQAAQQSHRVKVRSTRGRWFGHWLRSWLANERGKRSGPPEGGPPSGSTRGPRFA